MPIECVRIALAEIQNEFSPLLKEKSGRWVCNGLKKEAEKQGIRREKAKNSANERWKDANALKLNTNASSKQCFPIPSPSPSPSPKGERNFPLFLGEKERQLKRLEEKQKKLKASSFVDGGLRGGVFVEAHWKNGSKEEYQTLGTKISVLRASIENHPIT